MDKESSTRTLKGLEVTFADVGYSVPTKDGDKLILRGIDGILTPGRMMALMGPSGSGKVG